MIIRKMQESDLDFAARCTGKEGWSGETREVFESFHLYDPDGCYIAEKEGSRVGVCVATTYGEYGFIGELIVTREARGSIVGPRLLDHAVTYLKRAGARHIYLDSVEAASPFYASVGFRKICRSLRFKGRVEGKLHPDIRKMLPSDLDAVADLDMEAFGSDRRFFLRRRWELYPHYCRVFVERGVLKGYIMAMRGRGLVAVGPWICRHGEANPLALLEGLALETGAEPLRIGVLESNAFAVRTIRAIPGLSETQFSWRMVRGTDDRLGSSMLCLAIGSPAKG